MILMSGAIPFDTGTFQLPVIYKPLKQTSIQLTWRSSYFKIASTKEKYKAP